MTASQSADGARLRAAARNNLLGATDRVFKKASLGSLVPAQRSAVESGMEKLAQSVEAVRVEKDMDYKDAVRPWPCQDIEGKEFWLLQLESRVKKGGDGFEEGFDDEDEDDDDNVLTTFLDHCIVEVETGNVYDVTASKTPEWKHGVRANVQSLDSIEYIVDPNSGNLRLFGDTIAELVLSLGIPVDSPSTFGETALIQASSAANIEVCRWLVTYGGANAKAATLSGATSMHKAADNGSKEHEEVIRILAGPGGADINAANEWGLTPLHIAAFRGNAQIVKLLLELGGDKTRKDKEGKTPGDYSHSDTCYRGSDGTKHYNEEVEELLS